MARRGHRPSQAPGNRPRIWGRHAVLAALANPERTVRKMWATREALAGLDIPPVIPITYADVADLGRLVPGDAPHQGLVIEVDPLEDIWLGDLLEQGAGEECRLWVWCLGFPPTIAAQWSPSPVNGRGVPTAGFAGVWWVCRGRPKKREPGGWPGPGRDSGREEPTVG